MTRAAPSIDTVEEARQAVAKSRARLYLDGWEDSTRELTKATEILKQLELRFREKTPNGDERLRLRATLEGLRGELRLAERIHQQAGAWETSWAQAVRGALGLDGSAYGPDGQLPPQCKAGRMAWEG